MYGGRRGNGEIGAALATAATEVSSCLRDHAEPPGVMDCATVIWTARCVMAGLSIMVVELVPGRPNLAIEIVLGIVLFAVASSGVRRLLSHRHRAWEEAARWSGAVEASTEHPG